MELKHYRIYLSIIPLGKNHEIPLLDTNNFTAKIAVKTLHCIDLISYCKQQDLQNIQNIKK